MNLVKPVNLENNKYYYIVYEDGSYELYYMFDAKLYRWGTNRTWTIPDLLNGVLGKNIEIFDAGIDDFTRNDDLLKKIAKDKIPLKARHGYYFANRGGYWEKIFIQSDCIHTLNSYQVFPWRMAKKNYSLFTRIDSPPVKVPIVFLRLV